VQMWEPPVYFEWYVTCILSTWL